MISTENKTVGEAVAENPSLAAVFEKHRIDYCCHGDRPVEAVCRQLGLSFEALLAEAKATRPAGESKDWTSAALTELADHIVSRHHSYLRTALPSIDARLAKVLDAHAQAHGETLRPLKGTFEGLKAELTQHMQKEEMILFPVVRAMEAAEKGSSAPPPAPGGSVDNPIRVMEHEHENAGRALESMRQLTSDYALPADACNEFRVLYGQLEELEGDLHIHIHLENNILFPKASQLEERLLKR